MSLPRHGINVSSITTGSRGVNIFSYFLFSLSKILITKISMGVPIKERLVPRHAWPEGDFVENTRGSQRDKQIFTSFDDEQINRNIVKAGNYNR